MLSSFSDVPSAELAKQDKMTVNLGKWTMTYRNQDDLGSFLLHLMPLRQRPGSVTGLLQAFTGSRLPFLAGTAFPSREFSTAEWGWILKPKDFDPEYRNFRTKIREKDRRTCGREPGFPLFRGSMDLKQFGDQRSEISFNIELNPTRFAWNQNKEYPGIGTATPWRRTRVRRRIEEYAIDPNDNVLLGDWDHTYSVPETWRCVLRDYWRMVVIMLDLEVKRANHVTGGLCDVDYSEDVALKYCETYWEVQHDQALAKMNELKRTLANDGRHTFVKEYNTPVSAIEDNSPSISAQSKSNGERFKIYAKTNKRIRAEYSHRFPAYRLKGGRTSKNSIDDLNMWCEKLAEISSRKLVKIFRSIEDDILEERPMAEFFEKFLSATDDTKILRKILSQLIETRGFQPTNREEVQLVTKLKGRKVLISNPFRDAAAKIHPRYRKVFESSFPQPD